MPKHVFFSHSTRVGTPERAALDKLVNALAQEGYDILIDYDALAAGANWRPKIDAWMKSCHAAVILVTPAAIASNFCSYEWSALSFRRRIQRQFPIFPVFLGSKPDDIKGRADQIYEIGGYVEYAAIENILDNLKQRLAAEIDESNEPRYQITLIASALSDAVKDENLIVGAAAKSQIDLGGFDLDADRRLRLARGIMQVGLIDSLAAIKALQRLFEEQSKVEAFRTMVELVGRCAWVNIAPAQRLRICGCSEAARVPLGLNAEKQRTAEAYILAASDNDPQVSWPFGAALNDYGGEEDFKTRARAALIEALHFDETIPDDDAITRRLKVKRKAKEPVFVLLRATGLQRAWIDALRARPLYAGVTFLILTGPAGAPSLLDADAMLTPLLPQGFEDDTWSDYDTVINDELKLDIP